MERSEQIVFISQTQRKQNNFVTISIASPSRLIVNHRIGGAAAVHSSEQPFVKTFYPIIDINHLVNVLGTYNMPIDRLRKFILSIEDIEDRKLAAYNWSDYITALDCYTKTKGIDLNLMRSIT